MWIKVDENVADQGVSATMACASYASTKLNLSVANANGSSILVRNISNIIISLVTTGLLDSGHQLGLDL